jgi:mannose-6-phosphate isomerase-like protein (cupin superfamily)
MALKAGEGLQRWEIAVTKKLVGEYRRRSRSLAREEFDDLMQECLAHWIVVRGTAEVTCGDKKILLTENQSTYIPLGEVHRLANPGKVWLEIIEVQSGSYLGEDDIVRLEDSYGR